MQTQPNNCPLTVAYQVALRLALRLRMLLALLAAIFGSSVAQAQTPAALFYDPGVGAISFAAGDLKTALQQNGYTVTDLPLGDPSGATQAVRIILTTADVSVAGKPVVTGLTNQGYAIQKVVDGAATNWWVIGYDAPGAMYGGLELAEAVKLADGLGGVTNRQTNPYLANRGIKFNIPLDARTPTYEEPTWTQQMTSQNFNVTNMWSTNFWNEYLDQMARHRYNTLSLWSESPFPSLVRVPEYPNTALANVQGRVFNPTNSTWSTVTLLTMTMDEKIAFWRQVMQYGKDRGVNFYFFTWNIFVKGTENSGYGLTDDPDNLTTKDWVRKATRTLFDTYPLLAGIGVTAGEHMGGIDTAEKEQWCWDTYGLGVSDAVANAQNPASSYYSSNRVIRLIHRAHQVNLAAILTNFNALPGYTNADSTLTFSYKYSQAHMYASTKPGFIKYWFPTIPAGKKTWLTVRNDDYYYMRWGNPDFARAYLTNLQTSPTDLSKIAGFYMGPDGHCWGRDYGSTEPDSPPQQTIDKMWYSFLLWGRLSYDPTLPNDRFQGILGEVFPEMAGANLTNLFTGWASVSKIFPLLTRFYMGELDYQWYPEACWHNKGFHTVTNFIAPKYSPTYPDIDGDRPLLMSVKSYVNGDAPNGRLNPEEIANLLHQYADDGLARVQALTPGANKELRLTLGDIKAMAHLGRYYAEKIRGATDLYRYQVNQSYQDYANARGHLITASNHWSQYAAQWSTQYIGQVFIRQGGNVINIAAIQTNVNADIPPPIVPTYKVTTINLTNGSISLEPPGGRYTNGTVVTVTGHGNFGYAFASWGGDLSGTVNPTTITITTNDMSVTASFVVSSNEDVAPWVETFSLADGVKSHGVPTSWTATRSNGLFQVSGSRLMVNGGATNGVEGVFETAPINISGDSFKVSLDLDDGGGLEAADYMRFYKIVDGGAKVLIGEHYGGVSGTITLRGTNITGGNLKLRIETMVNASDEYYYFDNLKVESEATFTLTTSAPNGSISLNPPGGIYDAGTVVTVTATGNLGYGFSAWGGDLAGSNSNPTTILMNANKSVSASFVPVPVYTLTTSAINGSIMLNPPGGIYNSGTVVTVTASPNSGYAFNNWSGALTGSTNPTTITMTGNQSVTANFVVFWGEAVPWIENFTKADGTTTDGAPTSWSVTPALGNFRVLANEMAFNDNTGEGVFTSGLIQLTSPVTVSLKVRSGGTLESGDYLRFYRKVDGGPEVLIGAADGPQAETTWTANINSGTNLVLVVRARVSATTEYYHFDDLSVTNTGSANPTYTLTTSAINGSISLNPPGGIYSSGQVVTVTATGNLGYGFSSWGGNLSGSVNPTSITMNGNKSVTANFVSIPTYTLTTSATNGSITLNPPGGVYNSNTVVTVTAIPNSGYVFSNWSGNLTGFVNPTTLTMNGNQSVTANFSVLPPGNRNVLFVVGASGINPSDLAISNRLQGFGYTVQMVLDSQSSVTSANGKVLVLISSSVSSGNVTNKFQNVAVPVINWEGGLQDDFGFATNSANAANQTALVITNSGHPLAGGLSAGAHTVASTPGDFSWGEPGGSPILIARLNDGSHPCLYAYEPGVTMSIGTAPARRVHLFLQNNTFASLNADGLALFDAAVSWAIGQGTVPPGWVQPPVLQGGNLRLEWVGGTLQTTTNVAGPWNDVTNAASPHLQPTTNPAQFFRVKQSN